MTCEICKKDVHAPDCPVVEVCRVVPLVSSGEDFWRAYLTDAVVAAYRKGLINGAARVGITADNPNINWVRFPPPEPPQVPCAIEEYFKANPKETSVMMVCFCPRCSVYC